MRMAGKNESERQRAESGRQCMPRPLTLQAAPGESEAGLQKGSLGVPDKEHRLESNGDVVQMDIDNALKLQELNGCKVFPESWTRGSA